jgi:hypothetical protein
MVILYSVISTNINLLSLWYQHCDLTNHAIRKNQEKCNKSKDYNCEARVPFSFKSSHFLLSRIKKSGN